MYNNGRQGRRFKQQLLWMQIGNQIRKISIKENSAS